MPSLSITVLFFAFLLSSVASDPSVDISIHPATTVRFGERVRVMCYISKLSPGFFSYKVRLHCPIVSDSVACFQDCKATCQGRSGCSAEQVRLMSQMKCTSFKGTSQLQFTYEFPYTSASFAGHYMCQFFGRNSARTLLPRPIMPPPSTKAITKPPKVTKPIPKATKPTPRPPPKEPPITGGPTTKKKCEGASCWPPLPPWETPRMKDREDLARTREKLLVAVFILCLASFAANIIFCVRCSLVNHYAKRPQRLQRMSYCMSGFLCLDPEVYLRKREPSLSLRAGCSASLMASHIGADRDDANGSDSTYSMPAYHPGSNARSQTMPNVMGTTVGDNSKNIVFIPVLASSLSTLRSGSHPGLNYPLNDATSRLGVVVAGPGGSGGDSGVGASTRCLAVSPQPQVHVPAPPPTRSESGRDLRRLSDPSARLYGNGRLNGRNLSGDSPHEIDEEETLIE